MIARPSPSPEAPDAPDAPDIVVELELGRSWPLDGYGPIGAVLRQLPDPARLDPGARVLVLPTDRASRPTGWWQRAASALAQMFGARPREAALAVRCTALLARGYVNVGAGRDRGGSAIVAWGFAPKR